MMNRDADLRYIKNTNRLFLSLILLYLVLEFLIAVISTKNIELSIVASLILSQGALIVPALIFISAGRLEFREWVPFKKIRWSTFWLTILFTLCISPFAVWINLLSQLFTTNIIAELADELLSEPPAILILIIGILGPFCEEFAFRGVIYHGLRRAGLVLASIFAAGLFFGLMHMNLNQFCYAFVLGVAFGFLTEATASIIPSLIVHLCINTFNVGLEFLADYAYSAFGGDSSGLSSAISETNITKNEIFYIAGLYMVPALIGLVLSIVVFIAICRREGSLSRIQSLFKPRESRVTVLSDSSSLSETRESREPESKNESKGTVPLDSKEKKLPVITAAGYIAIALCAAVILISDIVMKLIESFF